MNILHSHHWIFEGFRQVVTRKEAQEVLKDRFHIVNGRLGYCDIEWLKRKIKEYVNKIQRDYYLRIRNIKIKEMK